MQDGSFQVRYDFDDVILSVTPLWFDYIFSPLETREVFLGEGGGGILEPF